MSWGTLSIFSSSFFLLSFLQSVKSRRWRVCYQRGLPRLVLLTCCTRIVSFTWNCVPMYTATQITTVQTKQSSPAVTETFPGNQMCGNTVSNKKSLVTIEVSILFDNLYFFYEWKTHFLLFAIITYFSIFSFFEEKIATKKITALLLCLQNLTEPKVYIASRMATGLLWQRYQCMQEP